jgi:hypothetical protein
MENKRVIIAQLGVGKVELSILRAVAGPLLDGEGMSPMLPTLISRTLFHTH